ncbi:MBL fold metallo-hydrolase [Elioraea sp. Yellowstone]|jgi:glyoxylase-like metal-dependent hydrolase (beta-lactamase superfamily II)|uniref:MBL fold metallo-hydrolase n=1 Tax=Elioraea sp. Yellowstone TaxID=2592070 RepID=UPI0011527138|nr:MBL fold metallo-hydrolase [Elioraea sp. Yellowstone]TQF76386.1 MBL fold metallo-hydrolase [Elioraea sp. Yellowstone]
METIAFITEAVPPYGVAQQVHPRVRRIVARNPGPFTYHGTNTWIVGAGRVAVIDPGPDDPAHRRALLEALRGETVTHILVTHGHQDHAPGAAPLAAATGATVMGRGHPQAGRTVGIATGHPPFLPDETLGEGDTIAGEGWRLSVLFTPGHASDHLCFVLEGEGILFSGDHVMPWSTSMVAPPDGDMAAYMANLRRMLERPEGTFLAGHGPPIVAPRPHVAALLRHREQREAGILEALAAGAATVEEVVAHQYPGLAEPLRPAAARTVRAHLIKLKAEGRLPGAAPAL